MRIQTQIQIPYSPTYGYQYEYVHVGYEYKHMKEIQKGVLIFGLLRKLPPYL